MLLIFIMMFLSFVSFLIGFFYCNYVWAEPAEEHSRNLSKALDQTQTDYFLALDEKQKVCVELSEVNKKLKDVLENTVLKMQFDAREEFWKDNDYKQVKQIKKLEETIKELQHKLQRSLADLNDKEEEINHFQLENVKLREMLQEKIVKAEGLSSQNYKLIEHMETISSTLKDWITHYKSRKIEL